MDSAGGEALVFCLGVFSLLPVLLSSVGFPMLLFSDAVVVSLFFNGVVVEVVVSVEVDGVLLILLSLLLLVVLFLFIPQSVPDLDGLSTAIKFVWTLFSLLATGDCVALAMTSVSKVVGGRLDVREGPSGSLRSVMAG